MHHRRELPGKTVALIGRLGGLGLPALGQRLQQYGQGAGGVEAGQARTGLQRGARVRLSVGEVAGAEVNKGAVARQPEHVGKRAEPAGVRQGVVEPRQRLSIAFSEGERDAGVVEERGPVDRLGQQRRRSVKRAER